MNFLVTGATGFAGAAIARHLLERGDGVAVLTHDPAALAGLEALGARVHAGSILDPSSVAVAARGADVVVHPPGLTSARAGAAAWRWGLVAGTENVLAAARHAGVGRVVLVSSTDVTLADQDRVHWNEARDLPGEPLGERARALRLAEEIALAGSDAELSVTALRPSWLWGPGDTESLPALLREARAGGISMYGPGRNLVATTHIDSLVEAVSLAARVPHAAGQAYHLGDPEFLELREFLLSLSRALRLPPPRHGVPRVLAHAAARLGAGRPAAPTVEDVVRRTRSALFDVQKAVGELGFRATVTVEQGMKSLARWVDAEGGVEAVSGLRDPGEAWLVEAAGRAAAEPR